MDANKLSQILELLKDDEGNFNIQDRINEISSLFAQNDINLSEQLSEKLQSLLDDIERSYSYRFTSTEVKILEELAWSDYFGMGLKSSIKEISAARSFMVAAEAKDFTQERANILNIVNRLKSAFDDADIEAYAEETPEVALSIPSEHTSIDEVAKYLADFSGLLKSIQEAKREKNGTPEPIRIARLNKGSVEFFAGVDLDIANTFLHMLSDLATVYLATKTIRDEQKSTNFLNKEELEQINAIVDRSAARAVEEFLTEAPKKIDKDIDPEKSANIRRYLKLLFKWMPMGIHLEVIYEKEPEVDEDEGKKDRRKFGLEKRQQESLAQVKEMYNLPPEQLKLPVPEEIQNSKSRPESVKPPSKKVAKKVVTKKVVSKKGIKKK